MIRVIAVIVIAGIAAMGCSALAGVDFGAAHEARVGGNAGDAQASTTATGTLPAADAGPTSELSGECGPGSVDCGSDGATPRTCQNGQWAAAASCGGTTPVCAKGACTTRCENGDIDCAGSTPRLCQGGEWVLQKPCAGDTAVCARGECVACADGVSACVDAVTPKVCQSGRWTTAAACEGNMPDCAKGACVACSDTNTACLTDRTLSSCSPTGAYTIAAACTDGLSACLRGNRACSACPAGWANCNDAQDGCETPLNSASDCRACQPPERTCYPDVDADGYGDSSKGVPRCSACPAGTIESGGDCDDRNPKTHPGASTPQGALPAGATSWDTNCDGSVAVMAFDHATGASWASERSGTPGVLDCPYTDADSCGAGHYGFDQTPECGAQQKESWCFWFVSVCQPGAQSSSSVTWDFECL